MTTIEAINSVYDDIEAILNSANLSKGDGLSQATIQDSKDVFYYEIQVKNKVSMEKETYLIYNINTLSRVGKADDDVYSRKVIVTLDIYSRKQRNNTKIKEMLGKINDEAIKRNWMFEMGDAVDYDVDTKLYNYQYDLIKLIK